MLALIHAILLEIIFDSETQKSNKQTSNYHHYAYENFLVWGPLETKENCK